MLDDDADRLRLLEALLFASVQPLSTAALASYLPAGSDMASLMGRLRRACSVRGVVLVESGGRWALRTAPDLADRLRDFRRPVRKLSRAVAETLAIIAYHQPVTRPEIEQIRGVSMHRGGLEILLELGWIKPGKRRETLGRPVTWVTTTGFLDHFSLSSLSDLPALDEMTAMGLLNPDAAQPSLFDPLEDFGEEEPASEIG